MDDEARIHKMRTLFAGRMDAYGGDDGMAIWEPYDEKVIQRHLEGIQGCGVYPILGPRNDDDNLVVRWGCCDIDTGDWSEAYMLATALRGMGLVPWVERSRSKGWHIWIFTDTWVPASIMRRCLKVAYSAIDLQAKEANPKSENLRPNQLGNYVRLPYKGALIVPSTRQCMMSGWDRHGDGRPMEFAAFIDSEYHYSPVSKIAEWASKWYERPKAIQQFPEETLDDSEISHLVNRLPGNTRVVVLNGPTKADRSATLQALAYEFARMGLKAAETYQLVHWCDRKWGKYHHRPDGDGYIADIVNRAYS